MHLKMNQKGLSIPSTNIENFKKPACAAWAACVRGRPAEKRLRVSSGRAWMARVEAAGGGAQLCTVPATCGSAWDALSSRSLFDPLGGEDTILAALRSGPNPGPASH